MRTFLLTCLLGAGTAAAYGQANGNNPAFPTYEQIRPKPAEIIDIPTKPTVSPTLGQPMPIQLVGYPSRTVTYIINGKSTDNSQKAKKRVNRDADQINHIRIGEPGAAGKRTITIDFLPRVK